MTYKLIDIPDHNLERIINENVEKSEKILIVVSFIFQKGLELIFDKLKKFKNPKNLEELISEADFAICAYGVTLFELMRTGLPCITFDPHSGASRAEWEELKKQGITITAKKTSEVAKILSIILEDWAAACQMGKKASGFFVPAVE